MGRINTIVLFNKNELVASRKRVAFFGVVTMVCEDYSLTLGCF